MATEQYAENITRRAEELFGETDHDHSLMLELIQRHCGLWPVDYSDISEDDRMFAIIEEARYQVGGLDV